MSRRITTAKACPHPAVIIIALLVLTGCGGGGSGADTPDVPTGPPPALSGRINIEANTRIDADTADRLTAGQATTNNSLAAPQFLPSILISAGYLSGSDGSYPAIGDGPTFAYTRDLQDTYELALLDDQTLTLQSFATRAESAGFPTAVRVELRRRESPYASLDSAQASTSGSAEVTLPPEEPAGNYLVVISVSPGSNPIRYVLSTAPPASSNQAAPLRWPDAAFVHGEAIVTVTGDSSQAVSAATAHTVRQLDEHRQLMRMPGSLPRQQTEPAQQTLNWIRALRQSPGVSAAEPNYRVYSQTTPTTEPLYPRQWHYGLINAPTAWQLAPAGGSGVTVAVLDTGLFRSGDQWHPDLNANVVSPLPPGTDFVSGNPDDDPADPGDSFGSVYHGTHVAGTIAARADNQLGGTGVAYGSHLLPVRVLAGSGSGSGADLLSAIQWVGGLTDGIPKADIVNMSLGGLPDVQLIQDAISVASNDFGVIFVAAAGNENSGEPSYPAAFDNVFSVSAVDGAANKAGYSNFGARIDLAAPGGDALRDANADGRADVVISTSASAVNGVLQPAYIGLQGTSMAAPHVAGVFALMKSLNPDIDADALRAWLVNGDLSQDIGAPGRDDIYGYGLIDAGKAVFSALAGAIPKLLSPTPASLNFSAGEQQLALRLDVLAGTITLLDFEMPDWLSVTAPANETTATGFDLEVSIDAEQLPPDQLIQGTLRVHYADDDNLQKQLDVAVVAQILSDENARDAGQHFVILVGPEPNPDTGFFEAIAQTQANAENGRYEFSFPAADGTEPDNLNEVVPGEYFLVAGSDIDNDGIICSDGEACAEYPISGLRQSITVAADAPLSGIEMTTSYARPVLSGSVLPRPGFKGYRLQATKQQPPEARQLQ